jgi:hypothetical protein
MTTTARVVPEAHTVTLEFGLQGIEVPLPARTMARKIRSLGSLFLQSSQYVQSGSGHKGGQPKHRTRLLSDLLLNSVHKNGITTLGFSTFEDKIDLTSAIDVERSLGLTSMIMHAATTGILDATLSALIKPDVRHLFAKPLLDLMPSTIDPYPVNIAFDNDDPMQLTVEARKAVRAFSSSLSPAGHSEPLGNYYSRMAYAVGEAKYDRDNRLVSFQPNEVRPFDQNAHLHFLYDSVSVKSLSCQVGEVTMAVPLVIGFKQYEEVVRAQSLHLQLAAAGNNVDDAMAGLAELLISLWLFYCNLAEEQMDPSAVILYHKLQNLEMKCKLTN